MNSSFMTSYLISGERLSQFTIYGSNESHVYTAASLQCAYQHDNVGASLTLTCTLPVMAR